MFKRKPTKKEVKEYLSEKFGDIKWDIFWSDYNETWHCFTSGQIKSNMVVFSKNEMLFFNEHCRIYSAEPNCTIWLCDREETEFALCP